MVITFKPCVESQWPTSPWFPSAHRSSSQVTEFTSHNTARGISPRSADANDIFISTVKACGWVFFGGRQEADPRSECFTASPSHQRASQWARGEDKLPEE